MIPFFGDLVIGPGANVDTYTGYTGPSDFGTFGTGSVTYPDSYSGDEVGILAVQNLLGVPTGYVSGSALSDTMTFNNTTLANLGLTPGMYTFTWGSGVDADSLVVNIGVTATPLPATLPLFAGGLGFVGYLTRRRKKNSA